MTYRIAVAVLLLASCVPLDISQTASTPIPETPAETRSVSAPPSATQPNQSSSPTAPSSGTDRVPAYLTVPIFVLMRSGDVVRLGAGSPAGVVMKACTLPDRPQGWIDVHRDGHLVATCTDGLRTELSVYWLDRDMPRFEHTPLPLSVARFALGPDGRYAAAFTIGDNVPPAPVPQTRIVILDVDAAGWREIHPSATLLNGEVRWTSLGITYYQPEQASAAVFSPDQAGTWLRGSDGRWTKWSQHRLVQVSGTTALLERRFLDPSHEVASHVVLRSGAQERDITSSEVTREQPLLLLTDGTVLAQRTEDRMSSSGPLVLYRDSKPMIGPVLGLVRRVWQVGPTKLLLETISMGHALVEYDLATGTLGYIELGDALAVAVGSER